MIEAIDSDALGYVQSQLAHVEATVWEKKYTAIQYQELVPVSNEAGEYATSIEVHYMDGFTEGKFIGAAGDDMPFAQVGSGRDTIPVAYGGIGFEYTLEELRQSTFLNRPLPTLQAEKARRGFEEHAQRIAYLGDSTRGLEGLLNHSEVVTGAAASTFAAAADGDAIAAIINEAINTVIEQTKGIEIPGRVLLPIARMNYLATTRLDTTVSGMTILEFVKQNNAFTAMTGQPLDIRALPQLTNSLMAYSANTDVMVMHIPLSLRFLPPQPQNLKVRVPGEYKLSGLEMRYPGACIYRTGI